eukprot:CAMPEP_0197324862 /NCGR_PEP_ID=MMETSP0891-20130614/71349_1 /TAXON_ID=44058 ORGANISM="Aureoumbra lagunensis, Strain CCMP1510" /NCGR_SAMPLE_ID=MMETSP0891 /ASSEMBLY_ACC=CAM_ASM_000534 /LENGTH=340 /DNA_ID=CAMNT_0042817737 /DNA_START=1344 /DNA_END=2366 /DNA_ORIENTATION=+
MVLNDNETEDAAIKRAIESEGGDIHKSENNDKQQQRLFDFIDTSSQPGKWSYYHVFSEELPHSTFSSPFTKNSFIATIHEGKEEEEEEEEEEEMSHFQTTQHEASPLSSCSAHGGPAEDRDDLNNTGALPGDGDSFKEEISSSHQLFSADFKQFNQKLRCLDHKMLALNKQLLHLFHPFYRNGSTSCNDPPSPRGFNIPVLPTDTSTNASLNESNTRDALSPYTTTFSNDGNDSIIIHKKEQLSPTRASFADEYKTEYEDGTNNHRHRASSSSTSPIPQGMIRREDSPLIQISVSVEEEKEHKSPLPSPQTPSFAAKLFSSSHSNPDDHDDDNDPSLHYF